MKYNLSQIMRSAWEFIRKGAASLSEALRMAWSNAKAVRAIQDTIPEEAHTWAGWKSLGYEVIHESKNLAQITIHDLSTKSGTRKISFFGASQVHPLEA